jgi:hypothetical protein
MADETVWMANVNHAEGLWPINTHRIVHWSVTCVIYLTLLESIAYMWAVTSGASLCGQISRFVLAVHVTSF